MTLTPAPGAVRRRVTFGLLMAAGCLGLLGLDQATGRSFGLGALVATAFVLGMRELNGMLEALAPVLWRRPSEAAAGALVVAQVVGHEARIALPLGDMVVWGYALAFLGAQLRHEPTRERLLSVVLGLTSVFYVLLLGSFALKVRYLPGIGPAALFYLIAVSKGTDVFAFFTGRFLGKAKLIPWISPGKTVAGLWGGLAGAVIITQAFASFSSLGGVFSWKGAIPFGIIMGVTTVVGDLVESLLKRGAAVKDSGALVPEFGGTLDVIDCILFVAPVLYYGLLILGATA